jgi:hypothetical protein
MPQRPTDHKGNMLPGADDGPGLEMFAAFGMSLRSIDAELRHQRRVADERAQQRIVYYPFTATGKVASNGTVSWSVCSPRTGYYLQVRRISVTDSSSWDNTCAAAVAQFYVGDVTAVPSAVAWAFTSLPNVATFGIGEMPVIYGNHLVARVTSGTSGQVLQASALCEVIPLDARVRLTGEV